MKTVSREISSWILRGVYIVFGMLLLWQRPAVAQQYNGKELVEAELISDVSAIEPGQKFRLGVLYKIEPGWHRGADSGENRSAGFAG